MAEKQTNKDRMREIVDSIENGIKELFESDKYRQYLSTMSRFHRYLVNNTMLIVEQGKVVEVCAEPGEFTFDASTEPSIFSGDLGESISAGIRSFWPTG